MLLSIVWHLLLAYLFLAGHIAFVSNSRQTTTETLSPASAIHDVYSNYTMHLLPVLTPLEHDLPVPRQPSSIIGAFQLEINRICLGVVAWTASTLPGPDPYNNLPLRSALRDLHDRIHMLGREFMVLHKMVPAIGGPIALTVLKLTMEHLYNETRLHEEPDVTGRACGAVKGFYALLEESNQEVLFALQRINAELPVIIRETKPLLEAVRYGLKDADDGVPRMWIPDTYDAIDFTLMWILPLVEAVAKIVNRAAGSVSLLDELMAEQKEWYSLLELTNGVESTMELRYTFAWSEWMWMRRWLAEVRGGRRWMLGEETVRGLEEGLSLPAGAAKFLRMRDGWGAKIVRPRRPREG